MSGEAKQELTGYRHTSGLQYVRVHLQKYRLLMDTFVSQDLSVIKRISITADFLFCVLRYGAGINDYFQYNFYKRRAVDRKTFIVGRKWRRIITTCNGAIEQKLFDDKSLFNKRYDAYIGRDWLDLDECTQDEYTAFVKKHPRSIYKMKTGSGGNGIGIHEDAEDRRDEDYRRLKAQHTILEEIIVQHSEMAKFNPSSVNTLRLVTIVTGSEVKLMNAVFRTGNGEGCTDNFHHYGLAALIDTETGIVITRAVDKKNDAYYIHPRTGEQMIGFHIPMWDRIVKTVKEAALVTPEVRYVGWDVALSEDERICIIEGNCASDPDVTQMPDQIGKWPQYEAVLRTLR